MSLAIDHAIVNILFKNLNDPEFKDHYTLDEINSELYEFEGARIDGITAEGTGELLETQFHMRYSDYLVSMHCSRHDELEDGTGARISEFLQLSSVVS